MANHPMQPVELIDGIARFKQNKIVRRLLDVASEHGLSLNEIASEAGRGKFSREDQEQLAQLIGYSVSGAGDLSYMGGTLIAAADAEVERLAGRTPAVPESRPWCWRVRLYWRAGGTYNNLYESCCDGAFPAGTTAMEAIVEVAKWRAVDLATVISIETELLVPDPHAKATVDWTKP